MDGKKLLQRSVLLIIVLRLQGIRSSNMDLRRAFDNVQRCNSVYIEWHPTYIMFSVELNHKFSEFSYKFPPWHCVHRLDVCSYHHHLSVCTVHYVCSYRSIPIVMCLFTIYNPPRHWGESGPSAGLLSGPGGRPPGPHQQEEPDPARPGPARRGPQVRRAPPVVLQTAQVGCFKQRRYGTTNSTGTVTKQPSY